VLQSDLEEDESMSEPQDQNLTSSQNENDTLCINESGFVADSGQSSKFSDTKIKGIFMIK